MTLYYTFVENCNEYEYEFDADYSEAMKIVYAALKADGYDIDDEDEITDELIDEYLEYCDEEIKDNFCEEAYEE